MYGYCGGMVEVSCMMWRCGGGYVDDVNVCVDTLEVL